MVFRAVYFKKKKVSYATEKLLKAASRKPSGGLGVGRSSWCLSWAGEHVFPPDLDGETAAKVSGGMVGFPRCKLGSQPALGFPLSVSSPEWLVGSLCISGWWLGADAGACGSRRRAQLRPHLGFFGFSA